MSLSADAVVWWWLGLSVFLNVVLTWLLLRRRCNGCGRPIMPWEDYEFAGVRRPMPMLVVDERGPRATPVEVPVFGTFHSTCLKVMREGTGKARVDVVEVKA